MAKVLYFASILCTLLFVGIGNEILGLSGGLLFKDSIVEEFIHLVGFGVLGFGVFSSSLLGYLGYRMRGEEIGIEERDREIREGLLFGLVGEVVCRFRDREVGKVGKIDRIGKSEV